MNTISSLQSLLQKDITRKEFLLYIGLVIFALSGISNLLRTLTSVDPSNRHHTKHNFGTGPYGGKKA